MWNVIINSTWEIGKMKRCNQCGKFSLKKMNQIKSPEGIEYTCVNDKCPDKGWSVFRK